MLNIGVITWHSIPNHGAMLQIYALQKVFENLGMKPYLIMHEIKTVDPQPHFSTNLLKRIMWHLKPDNIRNKINFKGVPKFHSTKCRILNEFQSSSFLCTDEYKNMDAFCIGSDEVFRLSKGFTPEFFGENLTAPVFSYAGSFGQTKYTDIESRGLRKQLTDDFSRFLVISVRDENSKEIIFELSGVCPQIHIDPVLLYGFKSEIGSDNGEKKLLIYSYDQNMNTGKEIKAIKRFAKENNLQPISAGFYHYWCAKSLNIDPISMLHEFSSSQYVVTDTFHGIILSIITHRQFAVIIRHSFNYNKIYSLLKQLHLESRIANSEEDICSVLNTPIQYDDVENILGVLREEAIEYLSECIMKVKNGDR